MKDDMLISEEVHVV